MRVYNRHDNRGIKATIYQGNINTFVRELIQVSVTQLQLMYDYEKQSFCFRANYCDQGLRNEGLSRRYTIISLLGLHQFQRYAGQSPINIERTLAELITNRAEEDNIGDVGLLLWLSALASPQKTSYICSSRNVQEALTGYRDAARGQTMELAWFLAGLSHIALAGELKIPDMEHLALETYKRILANYGGKGIFGHMAKSSLAGVLRGKIGSFADQVYPIYALAKYAQAFGDAKALEISLECAETICRLQGPKGQWWWHYDADTGSVTGKYPVFSVHQHGMAPLALRAVEDACNKDFALPILKGLLWITGNNELNFDMVDNKNKTIWRCFYKNRYLMYLDEILAKYKSIKYQNIQVRYECRPYCLGWLLYAFSDYSVSRDSMMKLETELLNVSDALENTGV